MTQNYYMKVLVTGSAGFIGSALSIRLLDRGDVAISIDIIFPHTRRRSLIVN
jgi:nucleoside-diphosphate-sugar epimerase